MQWFQDRTQQESREREKRRAKENGKKREKKERQQTKKGAERSNALLLMAINQRSNRQHESNNGKKLTALFSCPEKKAI